MMTKSKTILIATLWVGSLIIVASVANYAGKKSQDSITASAVASAVLFSIRFQLDVLDSLSLANRLNEKDGLLARRGISAQLTILDFLDPDLKAMNGVSFAAICRVSKSSNLLDPVSNAEAIEYLKRIKPMVLQELERRKRNLSVEVLRSDAIICGAE